MKGYKTFKQYIGVNLIENGFNSYSTKGNTQLGKLIKQARKELPDCIVWYKVVDKDKGAVDIIYKTC